MRLPVLRSLVLFSASIWVHPASAQFATPEESGRPVYGWSEAFGLPGTNGKVHATAVYDDGRGPALYVGGEFELAGDVSSGGIARWDGERWEGLAGGIGFFEVIRAMAVFDDGGGPKLFVTGSFASIGGVSAQGFAWWDGTGWSAPATGGLSGATGQGRALLVNGSSLIVGGAFSSAGPKAAANVARWDGAAWERLGAGAPRPVNDLAVFDDGLGAALYAAGASGAPGVPALQKFQGSAWSSVAGAPADDLYALAVFDDGNGPELLIGGEFASLIQTWDGATFSALGGGLGPLLDVRDVVVDSTNGLAYVCGRFSGGPIGLANHVAVWDGATWGTIGSPPGVTGRSNLPLVQSLCLGDIGSGQRLFAGGDFNAAGSAPAMFVAGWDGVSWSSLGKELGFHSGTASLSEIEALLFHDDGNGRRLYAAGEFYLAGGEPIRGLARLVGDSWEEVGSWPDGAGTALAEFDDGADLSLFATSCGSFGGPCDVLSWNGASWSAAGATFDDSVFDFAVFDDGNGPALYAGGEFRNSGASPVRGLAKWDGSSWSEVGGGVSGGLERVRALEVHDVGSGPELYVGGSFDTAGGTPVEGLARWDGSVWTPVAGLGRSGPGALEVQSMRSTAAVLGAPELLVGGNFDSAGGSGAVGIATWDGASWGALGSGLQGPEVNVIEVFRDRGGPRVVAGGGFSVSGSPSNLASWDGTTWSTLGKGTTSRVNALATGGRPGMESLFVGGSFIGAGEIVSHNFAEWRPSTLPFVFRTLGGGISSTGGVLPKLRGRNASDVVTLTLEGGAPGSLGRLAIGRKTATYGNPLESFEVVLPDVVLPFRIGASDAGRAGVAEVSLGRRPLELIGTDLYVQGTVIDPGSAGARARTAVLEMLLR